MRVKCEPVSNLEIESLGEVDPGSPLGAENSATSEDLIRLRALSLTRTKPRGQFSDNYNVCGVIRRG